MDLRYLCSFCWTQSALLLWLLVSWARCGCNAGSGDKIEKINASVVANFWELLTQHGSLVLLWTKFCILLPHSKGAFSFALTQWSLLLYVCWQISWIIHIINCYMAFLTVPEVSLRFLCLYSAVVLHLIIITYEVVSKFILISNQILHFKKTQKVITDTLTTYVALHLSVKTGVHFLLCVCISALFFI